MATGAQALHWTRWLRAGMIAALWATGAVIAMTVLLTYLAEGASWRSLGRELVWATPLYLLISVPLSLLLSMLGHFLLLGLRWSHPTAFVLLGGGLGALTGFLATLGTNPGALIIICAVAGAAAGWGYHRAYQPPAKSPTAVAPQADGRGNPSRPGGDRGALPQPVKNEHPLSSHATQVRDAVLQAYPGLAPYLTEPQEGAPAIHVPHPAIPSGLVLRTEGGEITVGFRRWHTHGDLLGGTSPAERIRASLALVDRILRDEVTLAISYVDGQFDDAWVTDDPSKEERYVQSNEKLRIGTWSQLAG